MSKLNVGTLECIVQHNEAHFNPVAYSNIPECWEAEIIDIPEVMLEAFGANNEFSHLHIYGVSETREGAIQDIIDELKRINVTGKLRVFDA